jgi:hypothetical protein
MDNSLLTSHGAKMMSLTKSRNEGKSVISDGLSLSQLMNGQSPINLDEDEQQYL